MGESNSRKARRQREQQQSRHAARQTAPEAAPPAPAKAKAPTKKAATWEPEEVNFLITPGGLLQPEGAPLLAEKPKTVRVPGPLNVHLGGFQARHGAKRFSFQGATNAMWRMLLREEHEAYERARHEASVTGVPAQPKMGPLYRGLRAEMERMRREESGETFDEE